MDRQCFFCRLISLKVKKPTDAEGLHSQTVQLDYLRCACDASRLTRRRRFIRKCLLVKIQSAEAVTLLSLS